MSEERLGPPPVEPMSNAAWSRIERGLWERLDNEAPAQVPAPHSRRPWLVGGAALAAAAVIALVVGLSLRGDERGVPVAGPSRVVAGETPSTVTYADAHLTLEARAAVVLQREVDAPSVLVERGAVTFAVAPREDGTFVVRAGDVVVRVVGTKFTVARFEERVTVEVEHGVVDVLFRGAVHRLRAGGSWSSEPAKVTLVPPAADPPVVVDPPADPPVPAPAPAPARTKEPPSAKPSVVDHERAKFEQLALLERTQPEKALQGYLELSKGNTKWSAVALYAAGRLAADRNDKKARTFLTIYLKRFPTGANAEDARELLKRIDGAKP